MTEIRCAHAVQSYLNDLRWEIGLAFSFNVWSRQFYGIVHIARCQTGKAKTLWDGRGVKPGSLPGYILDLTWNQHFISVAV